MSIRFRRSIKIAPGVRLNVGKKSSGISIGTKGARVSINSNGRVTRSIGIPGTGISNIETTSIDKIVDDERVGVDTKSTDNALTTTRKKKRKPTMWIVLSVLFFISTIFCFVAKNYIGAIGCLLIAIVLAFVYRKKKQDYNNKDDGMNRNK